jgi:serine/threonine protein kinase
MIVHRDLKPGNIFFVDGHAKIGDLGLAISSGKGELLSSEKVGTFHYFAPELDHAESVDNIRDPTKLDIFSLGITVFEMFYHVIKTGMERHQILTNLRKNPAKFPPDFRNFPDAEEYENLIRQMISWDPADRPAASELLASSLVPRNDLQDKDKNWIIKQLTSNKADKDFRIVLDNLFANSMPASAVQNYGYDRSSDESRFKKQESAARRLVHPRDRRRISEHVRTMIIDLMKSYGAVQMTTPTFSPKSCEDDAEKLLLIDQSGNLIYPSFSLSESFVRYVSNHHVSSIRRYAIEKVYRKASHPSQSPVEKTGVAFDAVFTMECPQILPEAVLTALVSDVASLIPRRTNLQLVLKISHTAIFAGILRYCDIVKEQKMKEILTLLSENSENFAYFEKVSRVKDLVNDGLKAKLIHSAFLLQKDSFSDFRDFIKQLVRRKQSSDQKLFSTEVLNALLELKLISKAVESVATDVTLKFCGCLIENFDSFNGFVLQLEQVKSTNESAKLIAIGGKYEISDGIVSMNGAVGVSFDFDLIVSLTMEEDERTGTSCSPFDAVIAFHPLNHDPEKSNHLLCECMNLCMFLRSSGFKVMELFDSVANSNDNLITFCRENRVRTSVLLLEDDQQEISCRIFEFERDRPSEKKIQCYSQRAVADALKLILKGESLANGDGSQSTKGDPQRSSTSQDTVVLNEKSNSNFINMQFFYTDTAKLALHQKKRHEITFNNLLSTSITSASNLPVLAIDLPYKQIKMIANEIDLDDDAFKMRKNLDNACSVLSEKLPRLKKHLPLILDEIYSLKTGKKSSSTITIYSYTENKFVTIC